MYTFIIGDDNSMYASVKERIMQKSKCVDSLVFITHQTYKNTHDMTMSNVLMEYVLPVSRKYCMEILELSDERYKDCYLQYKLPLDSNLTSEAGQIEIQLTFAYNEMLSDGSIVQRVRKISPAKIDIIPVARWSDLIPDPDLFSLDQRLLKMDAQIQELNDYAQYLENLSDAYVNNLVYDNTDKTLQLLSNGAGVGNKISMEDVFNDVSVVNATVNTTTEIENIPVTTSYISNNAIEDETMMIIPVAEVGSETTNVTTNKVSTTKTSTTKQDVIQF